jgi:hypothetical protein
LWRTAVEEEEENENITVAVGVYNMQYYSTLLTNILEKIVI